MLNPISLLFLALSAFVFWVGTFVFASNPFNKTSRLGALLLADLAFFLLIGYLLFSTNTLGEYRTIFKYGSFPLMLAPAIWLHLSFLLTNQKILGLKKLLVWAGYLLAILYYIGFAFTDLVVDFSVLVGPVGRFAFIFKSGPLFYFVDLLIIAYFILAFFNFFKSFRLNRNLQTLAPVLVSGLFIFGWLVIISSYIFRYNIFLQESGEFLISASAILLAIFVIVNRLFLDGAKTNINREFFYSTIGITAVVATYLALGLLFGIQISGLSNLFLLAIFLFTLIATHSFYGWIVSFIRNLFYEQEISLPRVTDEEVNETLRNLRRPERLEKSSLVRLKTVNKGRAKVDDLKNLVLESIEYFKPTEEKRNRLNLKYQILKLISDQVEEGQILWDLGFEEYPLEITENADGLKPRLGIQSPTDYQATSRNAYISLKKEAIHDLAWRISYLEKHFNK